MKKIILACLLITGISVSLFAENSKYALDETKVNELFSQSEDVSYTANPAFVSGITSTTVDQTKNGFLIRAFFCGGFALHRSYMGTKGLFIKYFCTLGVIGCVDFWWTIIKGDEAFNKFKGNDKWIIWNDKK